MMPNREHWLTEMANRIESIFVGFDVAPYRISCSWPVGGWNKILGQCFGAKHSVAGYHELFISPTVDDSLAVAGTICHEMAHIVAGVHHNHGSRFVEVCDHAGITKGKAPYRVPGTSLNARLAKWIIEVGKYPHDRIVPATRARVVVPSMVKLQCPCGCLATMPIKWLNRAGPPTCGCGKLMVKAKKK